MTSLQSFNLSSQLLFHVISTVYLSFHLDSLHRHLDCPHFSYFRPDSLHCHTDSPNPYPHFSHLYSPHSVLQFPILFFTGILLSLYSLRIYLRKIVAKIVYDVISVITKTYLPYSASSKKSIVCEVWGNDSDWLKYYLSFMWKGGATCPKLSLINCGFNGMKHIFIQISVQVDPHVDNTMRLYG